MRKTILFFFLILFFSKNAYSSTCESEFQKPREGTEILDRAVKEMLEQNQLSPNEQSAIAYSAGKLGPAGAGVLKELLKKNPTSQVQKIIADSAGEIGAEAKEAEAEAKAKAKAEEAGASVLKDLLELEPNPKPSTQNAIARSAGKLGSAGAGILKDLLELEQKPKPYTQKAIARSAG